MIWRVLVDAESMTNDLISAEITLRSKTSSLPAARFTSLAPKEEAPVSLTFVVSRSAVHGLERAESPLECPWTPLLEACRVSTLSGKK